MKRFGCLILFVCLIAFIAVSLWIRWYFHADWAFYPALLGIEALVTAFALVIWQKTHIIGTVTYFVIVLIFTLGVHTGFELNYPPPEYEFSSCKDFWSLTGGIETGCEDSDYYKFINQLGIAGGVDYKARLRHAISVDLDEQFRATRDGYIVQSFPRFKQMWEQYMNALANEGIYRWTMSPELYEDTRSSIFIILFVAFIVNGLLAHANFKVVGVAQVVFAWIAIHLSQRAWNAPFPGLSTTDLVPGFSTFTTLNALYQAGILMGCIAMVLPIVSQIGSTIVGTGVFVKYWWVEILIVAGFEALAIFLDPRMSIILAMPTINSLILSDPNLTMAMCVWAASLGLIIGIAYATILEGIINFGKSYITPPS